MQIKGRKFNREAITLEEQLYGLRLEETRSETKVSVGKAENRKGRDLVSTVHQSRGKSQESRAFLLGGDLQGNQTASDSCTPKPKAKMWPNKSQTHRLSMNNSSSGSGNLYLPPAERTEETRKTKTIFGGNRKGKKGVTYHSIFEKEKRSSPVSPISPVSTIRETTLDKKHEFIQALWKNGDSTQIKTICDSSSLYSEESAQCMNGLSPNLFRHNSEDSLMKSIDDGEFGDEEIESISRAKNHQVQRAGKRVDRFEVQVEDLKSLLQSRDLVSKLDSIVSHDEAEDGYLEAGARSPAEIERKIIETKTKTAHLDSLGRNLNQRSTELEERRRLLVEELSVVKKASSCLRQERNKQTELLEKCMNMKLSNFYKALEDGHATYSRRRYTNAAAVSIQSAWRQKIGKDYGNFRRARKEAALKRERARQERLARKREEEDKRRKAETDARIAQEVEMAENARRQYEERLKEESQRLDAVRRKTEARLLEETEKMELVQKMEKARLETEQRMDQEKRRLEKQQKEIELLRKKHEEERKLVEEERRAALKQTQAKSQEELRPGLAERREIDDDERTEYTAKTSEPYGSQNTGPHPFLVRPIVENPGIRKVIEALESFDFTLRRQLTQSRTTTKEVADDPKHLHFREQLEQTLHANKQNRAAVSMQKVYRGHMHRGTVRKRQLEFQDNPGPSVANTESNFASEIRMEHYTDFGGNYEESYPYENNSTRRDSFEDQGTYTTEEYEYSSAYYSGQEQEYDANFAHYDHDGTTETYDYWQMAQSNRIHVESPINSVPQLNEDYNNNWTAHITQEQHWHPMEEYHEPNETQESGKHESIDQTEKSHKPELQIHTPQKAEATRYQYNDRATPKYLEGYQQWDGIDPYEQFNPPPTPMNDPSVAVIHLDYEEQNKDNDDSWCEQDLDADVVHNLDDNVNDAAKPTLEVAVQADPYVYSQPSSPKRKSPPGSPKSTGKQVFSTDIQGEARWDDATNGYSGENNDSESGNFYSGEQAPPSWAENVDAHETRHDHQQVDQNYNETKSAAYGGTSHIDNPPNSHPEKKYDQYGHANQPDVNERLRGENDHSTAPQDLTTHQYAVRGEHSMHEYDSGHDKSRETVAVDQGGFVLQANSEYHHENSTEHGHTIPENADQSEHNVQGTSKHYSNYSQEQDRALHEDEHYLHPQDELYMTHNAEHPKGDIHQSANNENLQNQGHPMGDHQHQAENIDSQDLNHVHHDYHDYSQDEDQVIHVNGTSTDQNTVNSEEGIHHQEYAQETYDSTHDDQSSHGMETNINLHHQDYTRDDHDSAHDHTTTVPENLHQIGDSTHHNDYVHDRHEAAQEAHEYTEYENVKHVEEKNQHHDNYTPEDHDTGNHYSDTAHENVNQVEKNTQHHDNYAPEYHDTTQEYNDTAHENVHHADGNTHHRDDYVLHDHVAVHEYMDSGHENVNLVDENQHHVEYTPEDHDSGHKYNDATLENVKQVEDSTQHHDDYDYLQHDHEAAHENTDSAHENVNQGDNTRYDEYEKERCIAMDNQHPHVYEDINQDEHLAHDREQHTEMQHDDTLVAAKDHWEDHSYAEQAQPETSDDIAEAPERAFQEEHYDYPIYNSHDHYNPIESPTNKDVEIEGGDFEVNSYDQQLGGNDHHVAWGTDENHEGANVLEKTSWGAVAFGEEERLQVPDALLNLEDIESVDPTVIAKDTLKLAGYVCIEDIDAKKEIIDCPVKLIRSDGSTDDVVLRKVLAKKKKVRIELETGKLVLKKFKYCYCVPPELLRLANWGGNELEQVDEYIDERVDEHVGDHENMYLGNLFEEEAHQRTGDLELVDATPYDNGDEAFPSEVDQPGTDAAVYSARMYGETHDVHNEQKDYDGSYNEPTHGADDHHEHEQEAEAHTHYEATGEYNERTDYYENHDSHEEEHRENDYNEGMYSEAIDEQAATHYEGHDDRQENYATKDGDSYQHDGPGDFNQHEQGTEYKGSHFEGQDYRLHDETVQYGNHENAENASEQYSLNPEFGGKATVQSDDYQPVHEQHEENEDQQIESQEYYSAQEYPSNEYYHETPVEANEVSSVKDVTSVEASPEQLPELVEDMEEVVENVKGRVGDWEICFDDEGKEFYFNVVTEESEWDMPTDLQKLIGNTDDQGTTGQPVKAVETTFMDEFDDFFGESNIPGENKPSDGDDEGVCLF
mmetsp:Transcript_23292/g.37112  ORF Transcript_23292/g.37112 Transcript_23292/m.37112 type:complete len:2173 (-) Transcript_23292:1975-8493(-)|eukprot:CAMPEP_0203755218 /NCGR_PEP_ID=MMETSP0098-20131031/8700_1 /ASSEMBLY_ACC=CAM_ASM_000208 /TAXON_ID=96639 /ORGANISM=" , Strain NY0313808BC1" /LENGTH=2172 /DNA_ID=CAMNT_0050646581 /DNA_START=219 /DNA_END=6737 /DNA_ORIENTATION=-